MREDTKHMNNILEAYGYVNEGVNVSAVIDQLVNNEEVTAGSLEDVANVPKEKSQKIINSWFGKNAMDRDKMSTTDIKNWLKELLK